MLKLSQVLVDRGCCKAAFAHDDGHVIARLYFGVGLDSFEDSPFGLYVGLKVWF